MTPRDPNLLAAQRFAGFVLTESREDGGCDIDGAWLQECAFECGLLLRFGMTQVMHAAGESCENCPGDCDYCYRLSAAGREAIKASERLP